MPFTANGFPVDGAKPVDVLSEGLALLSPEADEESVELDTDNAGHHLDFLVASRRSHIRGLPRSRQNLYQWPA